MAQELNIAVAITISDQAVLSVIWLGVLHAHRFRLIVIVIEYPKLRAACRSIDNRIVRVIEPAYVRFGRRCTNMKRNHRQSECCTERIRGNSSQEVEFVRAGIDNFPEKIAANAIVAPQPMPNTIA